MRRFTRSLGPAAAMLVVMTAAACGGGSSSNDEPSGTDDSSSPSADGGGGDADLLVWTDSLKEHPKNEALLSTLKRFQP